MSRHWREPLPLLGLGVLLLFGIRTVSNSMTWLHLALGRAAAQQGIPRSDPLSFPLENIRWVNSHWLYDLLTYYLWNMAGAGGLTMVHVILAGIGFYLLIPLARKFGGPGSTALALLLCGWLLAPVFLTAPRIACFALAGAMLHLSLKPQLNAKQVLLLCALQLLWVQLDASFMLGLIIVSLGIAQAWTAKPYDASKVRKRTLLLGGAALLTFVNPYGPFLHFHLVRSWVDVGYIYVTDWGSAISWHFPDHLGGRLITLSLILALLGLVIYPRRLPPGITVLACIMAVLVILKPRQVNDLYALAAFPFFTLSISSVRTYLAHRIPILNAPRARPFLVGSAVLAMAASMFAVTSNHFFVTTGSTSSFGFGANYDAFPEAAARIIEQPGFPDRVLNAAHDGGYLAWRYPDRKVFVDARADLYTSIFYQHIADALSGDDEHRRSFMDKWRIDGIIMNCCLPKAAASTAVMLNSGRWGLAYFDGTTAILLRKTSAYQALLGDERLQLEGLKVLERARQRYAFQVDKALFRAPHAARLFGAGAFFTEMHQYEKAIPVYALLARGIRNLPLPWTAAGYAHIKLRQYDQAIQILEFTTQRFPKNFLGWIWLSHVYAEVGREAEAREAFNRASLLKPEKASSFGNPAEDSVRSRQTW